jgi:hypothetical protein
MAEIKQDGIYRVKGAAAGEGQFQFRKGHVVPDDVEYERVGDFPESQVDTVAEANAKAAATPENKAAPAPADKKA